MTEDLKRLASKLDRLEAMIGRISSPSAETPSQAKREGSANDNRPAVSLAPSPGSCSCGRKESDAQRRSLRIDVLDVLIILQGLRSKYIHYELLFDPVWNMLLDLSMAKLRGVRVSVSSACLASGVPETTALRYLTIMQDRGLVERYPDPRDKRRTFVQVSREGEGLVLEYVEKARSLIAALADPLRASTTARSG